MYSILGSKSRERIGAMLQKIIEELDKVKVGARLLVKKGVKFSSSVSQQEVELN